jgi:hypothetical protein
VFTTKENRSEARVELAKAETLIAETGADIYTPLANELRDSLRNIPAGRSRLRETGVLS